MSKVDSLKPSNPGLRGTWTLIILLERGISRL
jgi:hypothetical protein